MGPMAFLRLSQSERNCREATQLLGLRCSLYFDQDLIECRAIQEPPMGDNGADFPGIVDVFERVCAQQHQVSDLARFY